MDQTIEDPGKNKEKETFDDPDDEEPLPESEKEVEKGEGEDGEEEGEGGKKEDSRLGALQLQKENGNKLFIKGDYEGAYKEYEKGLRFFGVMFKEGDPLRPSAHVFKKDYHLNMASCCLRQRNFPDCKMHCDFVLGELGFKDDPKALFRKGLANKEMGLFMEAKQNFERVVELDTDEVYSRKSWVLMKGMTKEDKASNEKHKKAFGGMFKNGGDMAGLYDDKKDVDPKKLLSDSENEDDGDIWSKHKKLIIGGIIVFLSFFLIIAAFAALLYYYGYFPRIKEFFLEWAEYGLNLLRQKEVQRKQRTSGGRRTHRSKNSFDEM